MTQVDTSASSFFPEPRISSRAGALTERTWQRATLVMVAVMTMLRFAGAASTSLTDTEGYYVAWSLFPDLSYYDHPPMVAWTAWLATHLGHDVLAARITPVLCAALTEGLLFVLTARLFSPRAAFFAVLLHVAIPAYFFTALLVNPESTLAPSWLLALLALDDLRRHREWYRPLLLGAAIGVAFLSKYTAILLVPTSLLVLATSEGTRTWLRRPSLYAGGLVALAVASPVLIWNALRGWPSMQLHLSERVAPPSLGAMAEHGAHAALGQWLLFHPLVLPLLVAAAIVMLMRAPRDARHRFLACTSLPVLAFFAYTMSRVRDAEPHWTMMGFVPLLVAAGAFGDELAERFPRRVAGLGTTLGLATAVLVASTFVHARTDFFERVLPAALYDPRHDAVHETLGWDRLRAVMLGEAARLGPDTVVASAHNVFCGHLLAELGDRPFVYCPSPRRTQLDFEDRRDPPADVFVLFVEAAHDEERHDTAMPDRRCERVRSVEVERGGSSAAHYDVFACAPSAPTLASR